MDLQWSGFLSACKHNQCHVGFCNNFRYYTQCLLINNLLTSVWMLTLKNQQTISHKVNADQFVQQFFCCGIARHSLVSVTSLQIGNNLSQSLTVMPSFVNTTKLNKRIWASHVQCDCPPSLKGHIIRNGWWTLQIMQNKSVKGQNVDQNCFLRNICLCHNMFEPWFYVCVENTANHWTRN